MVTQENLNYQMIIKNTVGSCVTVGWISASAIKSNIKNVNPPKLLETRNA